MIVMAQFRQTRPLAIFLSANGEVADMNIVDEKA
jgi:hypothetical protein